MEKMNIQWYPGHMTKTRRMIQEQMKHMDAVCEILDARAPLSSRNPAWFRGRGFAVRECNARQGQGTRQFPDAVRSLLSDKLAAYAEKGQAGRMLRVMILGIPNVGKSTFINQVARRKTARTEDRPGVTRAKQWVPVDQSLELLDTPGMLWPKFEDPGVAFRLACTGAVRDEIMDLEELAARLMAYLGEEYPQALAERYKVEAEAEDSGYDLLMKAGRKRGFVLRGGEIDTERMARILLDEFRGGKLGRFTLETPPVSNPH